MWMLNTKYMRPKLEVIGKTLDATGRMLAETKRQRAIAGATLVLERGDARAAIEALESAEHEHDHDEDNSERW